VWGLSGETRGNAGKRGGRLRDVVNTVKPTKASENSVRQTEALGDAVERWEGLETCVTSTAEL